MKDGQRILKARRGRREGKPKTHNGRSPLRRASLLKTKARRKAFCVARLAFKACQKVTSEPLPRAQMAGSSKYSDKPATPITNMRPKNRPSRKLRPLIQTRAAKKSGKKPIMAQLLAIPAP